MKILCCEAPASSCSSKGLAQGHVEKLHFGKRKSARLSHALIAKHSRKLQGLCLRLQAATSVTHANLFRYVCTPVSPGLRWPGQAITGSWPPACFMKISHVHVCMCTSFGSDALRSWPRTVHTHTHTHLKGSQPNKAELRETHSHLLQCSIQNVCWRSQPVMEFNESEQGPSCPAFGGLGGRLRGT